MQLAHSIDNCAEHFPHAYRADPNLYPTWGTEVHQARQHQNMPLHPLHLPVLFFAYVTYRPCVFRTIHKGSHFRHKQSNFPSIVQGQSGGHPPWIEIGQYLCYVYSPSPPVRALNVPGFWFSPSQFRVCRCHLTGFPIHSSSQPPLCAAYSAPYRIDPDTPPTAPPIPSDDSVHIYCSIRYLSAKRQKLYMRAYSKISYDCSNSYNAL